MEKLSELVWIYVKQRPFLREILRERIVNYSALARKISIEAFGSTKNENAIKMALTRLSKKLEKQEEDLEGKILEVLKGSSVAIRSKITVVISKRELEDIEYLSFVEGRGFITYILEEKEAAEKIRKSKSIVSVESNLNMISLHSSPAVEETPGVIAHVLNALATEGINVVEFVSCYTETILIVKQSDTTRAYGIISALTE